MDQQNKPASQDKNFCAFCKNIAKAQCNGCLKVYYCNKEHQKLDWKFHAKNCSVLKLVKDTSGHLYYVATRNIKVDEIVYEEKEPIVIGPMVHEPLLPLCLSCYIELTKETARPCATCGWPLCRDCKTHGPECGFTTNILKQKISITNFERPNVYYGIVMAARTLALIMTNPSTHSKIAKLQVCTDNGHVYSKICKQMKQHVEPYMLHLTPEQRSHLNIGLYKDISAMMYHGHMITIKRGQTCAVYENVRYFKNNCTPNCTKIVSDIGGISIRAVSPISKGENVTICYVDPSLDAMRRRKWLLINFIECRCKRCKDPTEFGSMYNSVKCIKKSCDGYMLPPTFVVDNRNDSVPDFICDKCNGKVSHITILDMLGQDEDEWSMLESSACCDVSTYTNILEKQRKIFHEGHGNIVRVKALMVKGIANSLKQISNELLIEYMRYCKEVAQSLKLLTPFKRNEQGICLFQWLKSRCVYFERNGYENFLTQNPNFQEDSMDIICKCNDLLNEPSTYCGPEAELLSKLKKIVAQIIADNILYVIRCTT